MDEIPDHPLDRLIPLKNSRQLRLNTFTKDGWFTTSGHGFHENSSSKYVLRTVDVRRMWLYIPSLYSTNKPLIS